MLPVAAGIAAGTGQAPFDLELLALLGFAGGGFAAMSARTALAAFWAGCLFGAAYYAVTLHWIVEPFLVDIARHGWMAPFALVFLAGGLSLIWAAATALAHRLAVAPVAFPLTWAAALTLAEWIRSWLFTGFPWAAIGYIWTDTPLLPLAGIVGPIGLTLATLTLAALGLFAALALRRIAGLFAAPLVGAALGLTAAAIPADAPEPAADAPMVRLIQPNAPQHQKWDPEHVNTFYRRQLALTAEPGAQDLIVWPETAIPWRLSRAEEALAQIAQAAGGARVALGLLRSEGVRHFNSLAVLDATGAVAQLYDKHHLVPFGEYVPLGPVARAAGLRGIAADDGYGFSAGPGPRTLDLGPLGRALPLICYEAIFPRNIRRAGTRPDVLLHITNDAWFGEFAGPQQHLAQARMRAAEFGLPVLRAANTGISAVIDARGRILASLSLGTSGYIDHALPPPRPPTLYARIGDVPVLVTILMLLSTAGFTAFTTSRKSD